MIQFAVEPWSKYVEDAEKLWPRHYAELALDQDKINLCVDRARYAEGEKNNVLHVVTAREDGQLVGYLTAAILGHLHYADAGLMAYVDVYFLLPEYRKGGCGAKMLAFTEKSLADRGVRKVYITTKVHQDNSTLLESLGWRLTDKTFTRFLG